MRRISRRAVIGSAGLLTAGAVIDRRAAAWATEQAPAAATRPPTIPQVREWSTAAGNYAFGSTTRLVIDTAHASTLLPTAETMSDDLLAISGRRLTPAQATTANTGDIFLTLGSTDSQLGDEGYRMVIGSVVRIEARTARGAFYGTRTLLQLLRRSSAVPAGTIRDWPLYPERGLLIGNEPQKFSLQWWQEQIRELAYLKMNMLWVYIGYPQATVPDLQAVAAFARRYHVTVVPQLNMPGHMEGLLTGQPDLHLPGRPQSLDLSKDSSYSWAQQRLATLVPAIASPYWHTGADEYMLGGNYSTYPQLEAYAKAHYGAAAIPEDIEHGFVRMVNQLVRGHGRTLRMWNDGITPGGVVPVDKNVVIEHWKPWRQSAAQLLAAGYKVQNSHWQYLYFDAGGVSRLDPAKIYDEFRVGLLADSSVAEGTSGLLGAKLHVWIITPPFPEKQIAATLFAPLRSLAQATWGSPRDAVLNYAAFAPLIEQTGHAPGTSRWLADTTGLAGRGFVRGNEQHVVVGAGTAGGLLHWSYSDATGVRRDSWPGPRVADFPIGFRHGEQYHVFARGADGSLLHWVGEPGQLDNLPHLTGWSAGANTMTSDPAAFSYADQQHVFYRNSVGGLEHRFYDRSSDAVGVENWAGELEGNPFGFVFADEQHVFGRGPDGSLRHWWYHPRQTTSPQRDTWAPAGSVASGMTGFAYGDQQHIFYRNSAGRLMHHYYDHSQNGRTAEDWGGSMVGDPLGFVFGDQQHVFGRGPDGSLRHWFYFPGMAQPPATDSWAPAGTVTSSLTGFAFLDQQHVFFRSADGSLGHRYWDVSAGSLGSDNWGGSIAPE